MGSGKNKNNNKNKGTHSVVKAIKKELKKEIKETKKLNGTLKKSQKVKVIAVPSQKPYKQRSKKATSNIMFSKANNQFLASLFNTSECIGRGPNTNAVQESMVGAYALVSTFAITAGNSVASIRLLPSGLTPAGGGVMGEYAQAATWTAMTGAPTFTTLFTAPVINTLASHIRLTGFEVIVSAEGNALVQQGDAIGVTCTKIPGALAVNNPSLARLQRFSTAGTVTNGQTIIAHQFPQDSNDRQFNTVVTWAPVQIWLQGLQEGCAFRVEVKYHIEYVPQSQFMSILPVEVTEANSLATEAMSHLLNIAPSLAIGYAPDYVKAKVHLKGVKGGFKVGNMGFGGHASQFMLTAGNDYHNFERTDHRGGFQVPVGDGNADHAGKAAMILDAEDPGLLGKVGNAVYNGAGYVGNAAAAVGDGLRKATCSVLPVSGVADALCNPNEVGTNIAALEQTMKLIAMMQNNGDFQIIDKSLGAIQP